MEASENLGVLFQSFPHLMGSLGSRDFVVRNEQNGGLGKPGIFILEHGVRPDEHLAICAVLSPCLV